MSQNSFSFLRFAVSVLGFAVATAMSPEVSAQAGTTGDISIRDLWIIGSSPTNQISSDGPSTIGVRLHNHSAQPVTITSGELAIQTSNGGSYYPSVVHPVFLTIQPGVSMDVYVPNVPHRAAPVHSVEHGWRKTTSVYAYLRGVGYVDTYIPNNMRSEAFYLFN
jgi:hypothetical protein